MKSRFISLFKGSAERMPHPLRKQIDRARELHRLQDYEGAGQIYSSMLASNPENPELHYRFGNLLKDRDALQEALASYDCAIELDPQYAHALCNRAVVLGLLGRHSEALQGYDRAIQADPRDPTARCNRATLLVGLGQKDAALAGFQAVLEQDASNFAAHFGCGALLQERKSWQESLGSYERAIAINPMDVAVHYNRAVVAKELKRYDEAIHACERAIELNPLIWNVYAKRAEVFQELKRYPEALVDFDKAAELNSSDPGTFNNRGVLRQIMGQLAESLADYDQAIGLNPANAEAWFNRGTVLNQLGDLHGALTSYDRALMLRPSYAAAYLNRGQALQERGQFREAVASYRQAVSLRPNFPEAHYNLALALLTLGEYAEGWGEYEWRWRATGGPIYREKRDFSEPLWLGGESIAGKTILLYAEQGLGDCLEFCRFVDSVAKLNARVVLEVPRPLVTLLASLPGVDRLIAYGDPLPRFDVQCPLMSLPLALGTTLQTIPSPSGYLKSDESRRAAWLQRLGKRTRPRIGLTWSGRAVGADPRRHVQLAKLVPCLPREFDYYCLQTEIAAADQLTLDASSTIFQFESSLLDFPNTAALCDCLDLVISIDTSLAHLACAHGTSTWVLLASVADWRWLVDRDDSPWYDSARLFRQTSANDWRSVFERVAEELRSKFG